MLTAFVVLAGVGVLMASMLAVGLKVFPVSVDARQEMLMEILPGANCGACGYPGCSGYAAALVAGTAKPAACPPGGADVAEKIGEIMGMVVEAVEDRIAIVRCAGDRTIAPARARYVGVTDCFAVHATAGGDKKCVFGCLGLGSCVRACPFDAMVLAPNGLAVVVESKCTGCGKCVTACPRGIVGLVPRSDKVQVLCMNPQRAKEVKAVCAVGCTGCKLCTKQSPRFVMKDALAAVDPTVAGDIPEEAPLVCASGAIFDGRRYTMLQWVADPAARADHEARAAARKEAEKARKVTARKPRDGVADPGKEVAG